MKYNDNFNESVGFCVKQESKKASATKQRITDALFQLLRNDTIDRITVGEVCAIAQVNRSTFYSYFANIYDVREQCEQDILKAAGGMISELLPALVFGTGSLSAEILSNTLSPYFEYINVLLNGGDPAFSEHMKALVRKNLLAKLGKETFTEKQEYAFVAIMGMHLGMIAHWLQSERVLSVHELLGYVRTAIQQGPAILLAETV